MKRVIVFLSVIAIVLGLAACGGGGTSEPAQDESAQSESASEKIPVDISYDFGDVVIDITSVSFGYDEFEDSGTIIFHYTFTNKTDESQNPGSFWWVRFSAIQDNDPNVIVDLEGSSLPEEYFDVISAEVKPNGMMDYAASYVLIDDVTPVTLIASQYGEELGRTEIKIK